MPNFLRFLSRPHSYLGIDIGTASIKIAEIENTLHGPRMLNYAIGENPESFRRVNEAIQSSFLKIDAKGTAEVLKKMMREAGFRTRNAVVSLPPFAAFLTFLDLPLMSDEDTIKALQFQIPKHIPLALEEMSLDWIKIEERKNEKEASFQQILIVAVPRERILRYQEIFRAADLKVKVMELETLALVRSAVPPAEPPAVILDIGSRSTNIAVVKRGALRYSVQSDYASFSLTQAIANGMSINMKRAEELKKQKGIVWRAEEYELSTLTLPFLDVIISEIKKAQSIFEGNSGEKISKVILTGGGANLLGFPRYVKEQIGLEAELINPFSRVGLDDALTLIKADLSPRLAVAIGLGMREFV